MREICASGSVGGEGGKPLAYPAGDKLPVSRWWRIDIGRRSEALSARPCARTIRPPLRRLGARPRSTAFPGDGRDLDGGCRPGGAAPHGRGLDAAGEAV